MRQRGGKSSCEKEFSLENGDLGQLVGLTSRAESGKLLRYGDSRTVRLDARNIEKASEVSRGHPRGRKGDRKTGRIIKGEKPLTE